MKRVFVGLAFAVLLALLIQPVAAQEGTQSGTRAPVVLTNAPNNNVNSAHPFSPNFEAVVTGVFNATVEGSEPQHTCATGAHSRSVWFRTEIPTGTLTLDTSGTTFTIGSGPSANSVISVYRLNNYAFFNFTNLLPVACNDNGSGAGIINAQPITEAGEYYIQISAPPGLTVTGASDVYFKGTFTPSVPHPFDNPSSAAKLKFSGLPTIAYLSNATVALDEPFDPMMPGTITNTVWMKFTYPTQRIFSVTSFASLSSLYFSLFQKSGSNYVPAAGILNGGGNSLTAVLAAGTYYLRIGVAGEPAGTTTSFITFASMAYLNPVNFEFSTAALNGLMWQGTEGLAGATPSMQNWKVKKGTPEETAACDAATPYRCYFRFVSSGANEKTTLKSNVSLTGINFKRGDLLVQNVFLGDMVGTPNLRLIFTLTNAAGATQVYTMPITTTNPVQATITNITGDFSPVTATFVIKNKDIVAANSVDLDGISTAVLRTGEAVSRSTAALKLPLGGEIPAGWGGTTAPEGVLPMPVQGR